MTIHIPLHTSPAISTHRFRVCQLVGKMLTYASESECKVEVKLLDAVQDVMLIRIQDKVRLYIRTCMHVSLIGSAHHRGNHIDK